MIRIHRGPEPARLGPERDKRLKVASGHVQAGTLEREHIVGYGAVRGDLWRAQHFKCCYCEKNNLEASHSDVEHFRPALRADRGPGFPTHGYWWLAWTWSNLLFVCPVCNRNTKNDQFPLDAASVPLQPHEQPPGGEFPLLIDPCVEDPIRHIQFQPVALRGRPRWAPFARSGSRRGFTTISTLKLDRPELLDLYDVHVEQHVVPVVKRLEEVIRARDSARVQEVWRNDVLVLMQHSRPFAALSYDAIDHHVAVGVRRTWRLTFQRPR
jgi:uncharacterized protein (TIGR02646 family)